MPSNGVVDRQRVQQVTFSQITIHKKTYDDMQITDGDFHVHARIIQGFIALFIYTLARVNEVWI